MPAEEFVATCDACGMRRKCIQGQDSWTRYCVAECAQLSQEDRYKVVWKAKPRRSSKFAYPIIGGPLDGKYATTDDFAKGSDPQYKHARWYSEPGIYGKLSNEYTEFNSGSRSSKKIGASPSMIFVHKSLLKPLISDRQLEGNR